MRGLKIPALDQDAIGGDAEGHCPGVYAFDVPYRHPSRVGEYFPVPFQEPPHPRSGECFTEQDHDLSVLFEGIYPSFLKNGDVDPSPFRQMGTEDRLMWLLD